MANITEVVNYDTAIYQIATTDAVMGGAGGIANAQAQSLANRTAYLLSQINNIIAGDIAIPGFAPINNPGFTGSPTAPTQALGDNSPKLATDAFVQATIGGVLSQSLAGLSTLTLTASQAGNGILKFSGSLTSNCSVLVPASPTRSWVIVNGTSGAYTLTIKTPTGTGVLVTQGKSAIIYTDGTNCYDALSDFNNIALTGSATAPTHSKTDSSTNIATTAFVDLNTRYILTSATTFYVSNSGSDTNGNGTSSSPWQTIQFAWQTIHNTYDLNGYVATIQLSGGTNFTAGLAASGQIPGQYGPSSIVLDGGGLTLTTTSATAIYAGYGAVITLQNIHLGTVTDGDCIGVNFGAQVLLGPGVIFMACARAHMDCWSGGSILVGQNYTINGGGIWHMLADGGGFISTATSNIAPVATLSGTPSFSGAGSAFLFPQNGGIIELGHMTFSGAATGQKLLAQYNGILSSYNGLIASTGGINSTAIPGNIAGVQQYGGQIY